MPGEKLPLPFGRAIRPARGHEKAGPPAKRARRFLRARHKRQPGRIELLRAIIETPTSHSGQTALQLAILDDGKIVQGDSGGGIWYQGKLVGNTWAVVRNDWLGLMTTENGLFAPLPEVAQANP